MTMLCSPKLTQVAAQVVLLSSPIPGQPLTSSSNPSVDDEFVGELKSILSMAGSAHRLSRVERALPYELRAVEVGLATAVRAWEVEAIALEHRTRPTLRALLQKVANFLARLLHKQAFAADIPVHSNWCKSALLRSYVQHCPPLQHMSEPGGDGRVGK